jgi:ABC-type nickel/cobalt efflux system permease component RcnA
VKTRARALTVIVVAACLLVAGGLAALPALAHPLGNFTVNRYSGIVLSPGRVEIHYVLDMAEIPTFQERPRIDADGDGVETEAEQRAYAHAESATLLRGLTMTADWNVVPLDVAGAALRYLPGQAGLLTLRLEATFGGDLPAAGSVQYRDRNFPGRIGWKEITVRSGSGVAVSGSTVPATSISRELLAYPKDLLASPLDVTTARFRFGPGEPAAVARSNRGGPTVSTVPIASGGAFAGLVRWRLTPSLLVLSLALAFLLGAVHALGPGHGKTITAAYLVGSGARVGQAVAAGAAVAVMHTASVLSLGLLLLVLARSFPAEHVYPWLTTLMGLVALGLGAGLFVTRLRARRRGIQPWHGHDHQVDGHPHPHHDARGRNGLAALAVAGGILPSPTAFVVLAGSISAHRLGYGLTLIAAFSTGLAAALILVGLLALRARAVVAARLNGRVAAVIPLLSALVIVGFGLFFALRGVAQVA